jgi:hypothetical protein
LPGPRRRIDSGFEPEDGPPDYLDQASRGSNEVALFLGVETLLAMLALGLIGYFVSEAGLRARPHPVYWVATMGVALAGALAGGILGWVRRR